VQEFVRKLFGQMVLIAGDDDCWEWRGSKTKEGGYGKVVRNGETTGAHRYLYETLHGELPTRVLVMHTCNNPGCVNPKRLEPGDHKKNAEYSVQCGRHPSSYKITKHNLTVEQIEEIRKSSQSTASLAKKFGVGYNSVWRVRKGQSWAD